MQLTLKVKIKPNKYQQTLIKNTMDCYINTANTSVQNILDTGNAKLSSKDILANLPSCLKNQLIKDAKSIVSKYNKAVTASKHSKTGINEVKVPVLKKPVAIWNNQNYKVSDDCLSIPVWIDGKTKRINIKAAIMPEQRNRLQTAKLGTLRITKVNGKFIAQIAIEVPAMQNTGYQAMGIDLGLKIPAVAVTETGATKFFGNGRKNKYIKRKFRSKRKELGKAKKLKAIRKLNNKEQRYMKDQDHKISRQIIHFAINNNVSTIRLERLANIRNTARTSRKNEKNLHTWSFYRLTKYIEYKANLAGIQVEYVNPKYTSQICPGCGTKNHANDRTYTCSCGYLAHRDRVGAINIIHAPVVSGNRKSA